MRVLMTTDTVGGVWTYSLTLARALRARGVGVTLATMGAPLSVAQRREAAEAGLESLHESDFGLEWMPDAWDDVDAAGRWLLDLASLERPDVVHLASFSHAASSWPAPVVLVGHSCVVSWWRAVHGHDPPREWDRYRREVARGLARADVVVAPTAAMLRELRLCHGVDGGTVVANASDAPEGDARDKDPLVLAAGRLWDPAKNLAALDRAAAELDWPVVAAGAGGEGAHVSTTGPLARDELAELRSRAAIFAAPARYEPFGLAALEAARAGCALVLGDVPSLREVWGDAALFADPGDHAALRSAIERLAGDERERVRMGERAQRRARRFRTARMARDYLRLYRQLRARRAEVAAA